MLRVTVKGLELFNDETSEFHTTIDQVIVLEHSLVSVAKWESKWNKPFISKNKKTDEEVLDYIQCMTITQNVDPKTYQGLSRDNIRDIDKYIGLDMTATKFEESNGRPSREVQTAELIYYWMISMNIPFECQKWHLNRLLALIRVCNIKNAPPKMMGRQELLNRNRELNAQRKAEMNTKG